ncbi:MAG: enoyl-CoA hydratase-related protein [bacterium]|nr:enoyl-CoA hydratase-related protein [bacterium]
MNEAVRVSRREAVLEVTLDRPRANAIDAATSRLLGEVFTSFRDDPGLRVAIFTGTGERFFCAGWDLAAAAEGEAYESDYGAGGFGGFPELPGLDKPVIAAVNGMAVGGGFELVMSSDLVVAADHATFFLPEAAVGVIPDAGTVRLPKLLPGPLATEMLIAGRRLTAPEALQFGLVNEVVASPELLDTARGMADRIVALAPLAVAAILDIRQRTEARTVQEGLALMRSGEIESYRRMLASEDAEEGPRAFAEKRDPVWRGR